MLFRSLDYDGDGYLDVFVSNYLVYDEGKFRSFYAAAGYPGPLSYNGVSSALYHNNGDGTFTDVTKKSGIGEDCCTTVASWADYNRDGYLDLYVGRYLDPRKDIPTTFYARNGEPSSVVPGTRYWPLRTKLASAASRAACAGPALVRGPRPTLGVEDPGGSFPPCRVRNGTLATSTMSPSLASGC